MDPVPLWQTVFFQFCLIGFTALFTLLESAAESLTESRLERLREEGDAHTDRMRAQLPHGEAALSAVQTGLCFLTMLSGCVAALGWAGTLKTALTGIGPLQSLSAETLFRLSLILILLLICFFTRLLGVELPRRMAALHADGVLRALFPPRAALVSRYPALKKVPVLLPAVWLARIGTYGADMLRGKLPRASAAESIELGKRRTELMRQYGVFEESQTEDR